MAKKVDTNSNAYTIIYASVVVVIVAFLLAFVSKVLEPQITANVEIATKQKVLASLNMREVSKDSTMAIYNATITDTIYTSTDSLEIYVAQVEDSYSGNTKYIIPLEGKGLWGPISGYIAINQDKRTVYGVYFDHEGETAGLGSKIKDDPAFQHQFEGKRLFNSRNELALSVVKKGKTEEGVEPSNQCDAVTGATLTSNGVDAMLNDCLTSYKEFLLN